MAPFIARLGTHACKVLPTELTLGGAREAPVGQSGQARKQAIAGAYTVFWLLAERPLWVKTGSPAWASECRLLGAKRTSISGG